MSADPRRPSLAELTQALVDAIRAADYEDELTADAGSGRVTLADGSRVELELLYEPLASATPEERAEVLGKMARQLVSPATLPATWAEARSRLRLQAKPRMAIEVEDLRRAAGLPIPKVFVATLTPHLALEVVVPVRAGALNVPIEALAAWGVTHEAAFEEARRNDDAEARVPWKVSPKCPGLFRSPWQDGFDGGRMINPRAFLMPLRGQPVVMVPRPSLMLMAGSEDEEGLMHLAEQVSRDVGASGRFLTLRAFSLGEDGESWVDWMPASSHPTYAQFRFLEATQERRDYGEQSEQIDAVARAKGTDAVPLPRLEVRVAPATGLVMTVTTWRSGRPTALPKADAIVLKRGAKTLGLVMWDDLVRAVPGVFERGPGYPERFHGLDFPEDWQLGGVEIRPWR